MRKLIGARVVAIQPIAMDCSSIMIIAKITEGPENLLDRRVEVRLAKSDIGTIVELVKTRS